MNRQSDLLRHSLLSLRATFQEHDHCREGALIDSVECPFLLCRCMVWQMMRNSMRRSWIYCVDQIPGFARQSDTLCTSPWEWVILRWECWIQRHAIIEGLFSVIDVQEMKNSFPPIWYTHFSWVFVHTLFSYFAGWSTSICDTSDSNDDTIFGHPLNDFPMTVSRWIWSIASWLWQHWLFDVVHTVDVDADGLQIFDALLIVGSISRSPSGTA